MMMGVYGVFFRVVLLFLAMLLLQTCCDCPEDNDAATLEGLQEQLLMAKTDAEKETALDQLSDYYMTFPVDSIAKGIETSVAALQADIMPPVVNRENIYATENSLKGIIKNGIVSLVQNDTETFKQLIVEANKVSIEVDSVTKNNRYWQNWLKEVTNFDTTSAQKWLRAEKALKFAKHYNKKSDWGLAEVYLAYAQQQLSDISDIRLALDISQEQMLVLDHTGVKDLAIALANQKIPQSDSIKYHLRTCGLIYNAAKTAWENEDYEVALKYAQEVIERTRRGILPHSIKWYECNGLILSSNIYFLFGDYEKSLSTCNEALAVYLKAKEKPGSYLGTGELLQIKMIQGNVFNELGEFDAAFTAYQEALELAVAEEDKKNQVICLQNMASTTLFLSNKSEAIRHAKKAQEVWREHLADDKERQIRVLTVLARAYLQNNDQQKCDDVLDELNALSDELSDDYTKAEMLRLIGEVKMKSGAFEEGFRDFQSAMQIFSKTGLGGRQLELMVDMAASLTASQKYAEADSILAEVYQGAEEINDTKVQIEVLGMRANIAAAQKDWKNATRFSNEMIVKIESISRRSADMDIVAFFHQKVQPFLKNAVHYELEQGRIDSAFIKLDYSMARAAKNRFSAFSTSSGKQYLLNMDSLRAGLLPGQLLLSYFSHKNKLHAFVLEGRSKMLHHFEKEISYASLKALKTDYINQILETKNVFNGQVDSVKLTRHYQQTLAPGKALSEALFGWENLHSLLGKDSLVYITPGDPLHGLPFASLPFENEGETTFLVEKIAISHFPSAIFIQERQHKQVQKPIGWFKERPLFFSYNTKEFPNSNVESLAEQVETNFPLCKTLRIYKQSITKKDILEALKKEYPVYILFGHSKMNEIFPDSTTFQLTAFVGNTNQVKMIDIPLADLKKLQWKHAERILLIGCNTGVGKEISGSGFASIHQTMLISGAKEVLSTLWEIDANEAVLQMLSYLGGWEQSVQAAYALQNAQIRRIDELRQSTVRYAPHPYLWAGFTLSQTVY